MVKQDPVNITTRPKVHKWPGRSLSGFEAMILLLWHGEPLEASSIT
jgi:hypothetical protein